LPDLQNKEAAMSNAAMSQEDARVGNDTSAGSESRRPIIERSMAGTEFRISNRADRNGEPAVICETQGAMSQQCSDAAHSNESVPQKLLQLVGYRDPNACPASSQDRNRVTTRAPL
jgi:hypothetical protein